MWPQRHHREPIYLHRRARGLVHLINLCLARRHTEIITSPAPRTKVKVLESSERCLQTKPPPNLNQNARKYKENGRNSAIFENVLHYLFVLVSGEDLRCIFKSTLEVLYLVRRARDSNSETFNRPAFSCALQLHFIGFCWCLRDAT